MAVLVGMTVALVLAALEVGIRTGWIARKLLAIRRLPAYTGWIPRVSHVLHTNGRRDASPRHT